VYLNCAKLGFKKRYFKKPAGGEEKKHRARKRNNIRQFPHETDSKDAMALMGRTFDAKEF
jgi:hypothetical protein